MSAIVVENSGNCRKISAHPGLTLAQDLFAAGFFYGKPLCSGLGHCGLCRVRFLSPPPPPDQVETEIIPKQRLQEGWRLSCRHYASSDTHIEILSSHTVDPIRTPPLSFEYVAIDIGTTTIKWQGRIRGGDRSLVRGQCLNPQLGGGSDVMARMGFALHGTAMQQRLQHAVIEFLQSFFSSESEDEEPDVVITGNSVMLYLLLGKSLSRLAAAPYVLGHVLGERVTLHPSLPTVYLPPLLSPFVGADISCGIIHLTHSLRETTQYPFVLADFGTNGEFVLALAPDHFIITSVAMGPALEGVGLTRGKMAGKGICTFFSLLPTGIAAGSGQVENGISGTGYLSLLALLRRTGVLRDDGRLQEGATPFGKRISSQIHDMKGRQSLWIDGVEVLTGWDIEEILKVKASCNYALHALLQHAGISSRQIKAIYLAGSLGEHLSSADLTELGFVPISLQHKIQAAGNTSLKGAWDLLHDKSARKMVEGLREKVVSVALAGDEGFASAFVEKMFFRYC